MIFQIPEKPILITGAGGFLGGELLSQLAFYRDIPVMALSSKPGSVCSRFATMANLECYSIKDWECGKVPLKEVNVLIHCAFARVLEGQALADSLLFTKEIFKGAVKNGIKGVINISSQSVYGRNKDVPWIEHSTLDVNSMYSLAKYTSELLAKTIRECGKKTIYCTNLRLASLIGPKLESRLLSKFVKSVLDGKPIKIIGGRQILSYMDVRDAAEGILSLLAVDPHKWKDVYNLGNHWRHTIVEIATMVKSLAKEYSTYPVVIEIEQADVDFNSGMDCSLFYGQTDWRPKYNLEMMTRSLFEYYIARQSK